MKWVKLETDVLTGEPMERVIESTGAHGFAVFCSVLSLWGSKMPANAKLIASHLESRPSKIRECLRLLETHGLIVRDGERYTPANKDDLMDNYSKRKKPGEIITSSDNLITNKDNIITDKNKTGPAIQQSGEISVDKIGNIDNENPISISYSKSTTNEYNNNTNTERDKNSVVKTPLPSVDGGDLEINGNKSAPPLTPHQAAKLYERASQRAGRAFMIWNANDQRALQKITEISNDLAKKEGRAPVDIFSFAVGQFYEDPWRLKKNVLRPIHLLENFEIYRHKIILSSQGSPKVDDKKAKKNYKFR